MIYRKLTSSGDYTFGKGAGNFLANSPEAVAQAIQTALGLMRGEWFLDISVGVPYGTKVLGMGTKATYDAAFQSAILDVIGVIQIISYTSTINPATRKAVVDCTVDTIYGATTFAVAQKPFSYSPGYLDTTFILGSSTLM